MKTNFTVSENTAELLNALKSFQVFKENYLDALMAVYGDAMGDELYSDEADVLDAVENAIGKHLMYSITGAMSETDSEDKI